MDETDYYMMVNVYCCKHSRLQLIWERSMGYEPGIYCHRCGHWQMPVNNSTEGEE